jgi:hypothetical protein
MGRELMFRQAFGLNHRTRHGVGHHGSGDRPYCGDIGADG